MSRGSDMGAGQNGPPGNPPALPSRHWEKAAHRQGVQFGRCGPKQEEPQAIWPGALLRLSLRCGLCQLMEERGDD